MPSRNPSGFSGTDRNSLKTYSMPCIANRRRSEIALACASTNPARRLTWRDHRARV